MNHANENRRRDLYGERIQAALAELNRPDYPAGLVSWLEHAAPELHGQLTESLPREIHQLWRAQAPLAEFQETLARFVTAHTRACQLYRSDLGSHCHTEEPCKSA